MPPVIKVCGIQSEAEALGAVAAEANTIGLLLGLTNVADDEVTADIARRIVRPVPSSVRTVMVTHLLNAGRIAEIAREVGVSAVQVHGHLPVEGLIELRGLLPGLELIKTVHVTGEEAVARARDYAPHVDMLLLDSRTDDRLGGTGLTHDWSISSRIVQAVDVPVVLAGGLNPENVARAIEQVGPAGIDANSGLEHTDGSKDFEKIKRFAAAGRLCRIK